MKKTIISLFIFIFLMPGLKSQEKSNDPINQIFTTLVIIEEKENNKFVKETFFSDGVFNALWDKETLVFFDMVIDKPLIFFEDQLDIKPFMNDARNSGADSILLIKFNYTTEDVKHKMIKIKADACYYNLYSMNALKSLRTGKISVNISEVIDVKDKQKFLNDIGYNLLKDIYKSASKN